LPFNFDVEVEYYADDEFEKKIQKNQKHELKFLNGFLLVLPNNLFKKVLMPECPDVNKPALRGAQINLGRDAFTGIILGRRFVFFAT
jgi:hypothetical protein